MKVVVNGDVDEAVSFKTDMAQQDMATAEESDSDHEGEGSQRVRGGASRKRAWLA